MCAMKRFKNALVVYDDAIGGDDALSQAVALCRENDARLTIATILRDGHSPIFAAEAGKRTVRLVDGVRHAGIKEASGEVLAGVPFQEIVRQVMRENHDLVIVSAEAGKAMRDVFVGRAAAHLMRKCPCPVWVIRPGQAVPYKRILAAIDPPPAMPKDDLNVKIMDMAASLASRDHALLHVVHAWEVDGGDLDTIRSETSAQEYEDILKRHRQKHQNVVDELLAGYPMGEISHHLHLPRDLPERAIVRLTESEQIDLVVMGTVGRCGIRGLVLGNTVEAVLRSVKCGMLAVKPDDYQSPIALPEMVFPGGREIKAAGGSARRIA
jgi:nucleotide-binding universal stress UspA family protein